MRTPTTCISSNYKTITGFHTRKDMVTFTTQLYRFIGSMNVSRIFFFLYKEEENENKRQLGVRSIRVELINNLGLIINKQNGFTTLHTGFSVCK